jgi:hypothetical protein
VSLAVVSTWLIEVSRLVVGVVGLGLWQRKRHGVSCGLCGEVLVGVVSDGGDVVCGS